MRPASPHREQRRDQPAACARPRNLWHALALLVLLPAPALRAQPEWSFEARVGGAWNAPMPIVIRQDGQENLRFSPTWSTRSFEPPIYYGWRITRWGEQSGWALDLAHHKLHIEDPPPEVQHFAISHGYNLLTVQRLEGRDGWQYGLGLGAVLAHPESRVRGQSLDEKGGPFGEGYYLSGPTAAALLAYSRDLQGGLFITFETRVTMSHASVPIAGGDAEVPNFAVHGTIGLGWTLGP
jgi:hypothetical protein